MQRVWHQPQKYPKPVMEGKHPWEGDCPCLYGTVLRVDGTFRMWYVGTRNFEVRDAHLCSFRAGSPSFRAGSASFRAGSS